MEIKTTLAGVVVFGGVMFIFGAQYGYHKLKERVFTKMAMDYMDKA